MTTTKKAPTKKTPTKKPQRDRHLVPVIVTTSGEVVAGQRRIKKFLAKNKPTIVIHEWHHYAILPFLRVAREEDGRLHLATTTHADEQGWEILGEEVAP